MGNYTSGACSKNDQCCRNDGKEFHNAKTFGKRRVELRKGDNVKKQKRR